MQQSMDNSNALLWSYMAQRQALGWLGLLLPAILVTGAWLLFGEGLQPSVSHYYYTGMIGVFVGVLFAIGVFLVAYKGFDEWDDWAADLAGICAIGVALFPTTQEGATTLIGYVHFGFATVLFGTLACMSFFLFTLSDQASPKARKLRRNKIYRWCGVIMAAAIILIGLYFLAKFWHWVPENWLDWLKPVLILETAAIMAFGVSWLTKGETLRFLADLEETQAGQD